jgi:peptidoglycan/xylan/chitin deacetylase (PgdA/CDA1 family)
MENYPMNFRNNLKKNFNKINFFNNKINEFRILLLHDIEEEYYEKFDRLIFNLNKKWEIIKPEDYIEKRDTGGNKLLITFDDGFKSNYEIAVNILKKYNIKALFFVATDFIDGKDIISKIYPNIKKNKLKNYESMSWSNLATLLENGHHIGSHTKSHQNLSTIKKDEIEFEIYSSFEKIKSNLNYEPNNFAYPFGQLKNINRKAIEIIGKKYKFIHSGLRGNNYKNNSTIIYRDAVTMTEEFNLVESYLNGNYDWIYSLKRKKIQTYLR